MIRKILILITFLLQCYGSISFSQVNVEWFRTYDAGYSPNLVNDFTIDSSGNSYLVGEVTRNWVESVSSFGTVKYNSSGVLQWVNLYQGSLLSLDDARAVVVDKSGNVYVTGNTMDTDSSENYCTIKYEPNGEIEWVRKYQAAQDSRDFATDIYLDENGFVYVTGHTYHSNLCYITTIKYDVWGNVIWVSRFDEFSDIMKVSGSIAVDSLKNVYVTGIISNNFCTIKYDSNGIQQWVSYFDNLNLSDVPSELRLDQHGNVYVLGKSFINSNNEYYTILVKYDKAGNQTWTFKTDSIGRGGNYYRVRMSFRIDSAGNIYLATGYRNSSSLIKLDSNGIELWNSKYNGQPNYYNVQGNAVEIDNNGFIYLTGTAYRPLGFSEFCTLKYNSEGVHLWTKSFYSYIQSGDESAFIKVDNSRNIYVAGIAHGEFIDTKFCVVKYSQGVGITNISTEIPDNYNLYQNYPNPFNPKTIITYEIPSNSLVTLKVYDISGKVISTLVNENQNAGKYEADFDGSNLASGVYYYRITADNFTQTKRMILLK